MFDRIQFRPCFIFIVYENQSNPDLWDSYIECDRFVYNKYPNRLDPFLLKATNLNKPLKTGWGSLGLVNVMIELLSLAHGTSEYSHFVFCSGSCAPVIEYEEFLARGRNFGEKGLVNISRMSNQKTMQWSIVNRRFCEVLMTTNRRELLSETRKHRISQTNSGSPGTMDEFYISTACNMRGLKMLDFFNPYKVTFHNWVGPNADEITRSQFESEKSQLKKDGYFFRRKILRY